LSKTLDGTSETISRAQKVKVFREAAREGLEQAKKIKATPSKNFKKPTYLLTLWSRIRLQKLTSLCS
jgi:hypothetical protein